MDTILIKYRISQWQESFWRWLAYKLPRKLVYFAAIRLMVHATVGKWSDQVVTDLEPGLALTRWELDHQPER